jgi:hypothetical protein
VLAIDGVVERDRVQPIINDLPGVRSAGLPVLLLSHEATAFYFYWGPVVPAATWLLPPSIPSNAPRDHASFVAAAEMSRVPWIVLTPDLATRWENDASPVRDLLRSAYQRERAMPYGTVYSRRVDATIASGRSRPDARSVEGPALTGDGRAGASEGVRPIVR